MTNPTPTSRPPAVTIMRNLGLEPDPWQVEVLEAGHPRLLLNCCRQAGKSTVVAILGMVEAIFVPGTKVLLVSRSQRQSSEMFRTLVDFFRRLDSPMLRRLTAEQMELDNGSRIVCLPCKEETIRGYAHVSLLVIDEAARVPDDVYRTVRPMLAVSGGRLICLSTPYGKRSFFYEAWAKGGEDWARIKVAAHGIPRIQEGFLQQEKRALGESWYRQEYECSFEALEGVVYPDFGRCVVPALPENLRRIDEVCRSGASRPPLAEGIRRVGGIDFGFRNPFAALWGLLDRDGVHRSAGGAGSESRTNSPAAVGFIARRLAGAAGGMAGGCRSDAGEKDLAPRHQELPGAVHGADQTPRRGPSGGAARTVSRGRFRLPGATFVTVPAGALSSPPPSPHRISRQPNSSRRN
jgi:hypothetical protein